MLNNNVEDVLLKSLAWGPQRKANKWPSYYVNGYKFNTKDHGQGMGTTNFGVCCQGGTDETTENNYYGVLTDIIEVHYTGWPIKMLVLFKCDWFDPTLNHGTKVDNYGIVEVKTSRRYKNYDPFIFAQQATQVYYTQYPEGQRDWLVVIKTKARTTIQTAIETKMPESDAPYQEESSMQSPVIVANDNLEQSLVDIEGPVDEVYGSSLNLHEVDTDIDIEIEDVDEEDTEEEGEWEDEEEEEENDNDEDV